METTLAFEKMLRNAIDIQRRYHGIGFERHRRGNRTNIIDSQRSDSWWRGICYLDRGSYVGLRESTLGRYYTSAIEHHKSTGAGGGGRQAGGGYRIGLEWTSRPRYNMHVGCLSKVREMNRRLAYQDFGIDGVMCVRVCGPSTTLNLVETGTISRLHYLILHLPFTLFD
jgi:hypothetical protein